MQSHSEVEGQYLVMSSGWGGLPSSVDGTLEWSCESLVDIAPGVEELRAKELKIQGGLKVSALCSDEFSGWIKERMQVPSVISCLMGRSWNRTIDGGKYLSKVEIQRGRVGQRDRRVGGKMIVREEGLCNRIERKYRESEWSPVVVIPINEKVQMCFEWYIPDAGYPRRLFPR